MKFQGWEAVCERLRTMGKTSSLWLNQGQRDSLLALAERLPQHGCIIADEVGMGKTRIAVALAKAVADCGGRVVITIPTGLGAQWVKELQDGGVTAPPILRSLGQFYSPWRSLQISELAPWTQEKILIVSHTFANWRFGENTGIGRWGLLPALYAEWHKHTQDRSPWGFKVLKNDLTEAKCSWMLSAAEEIWKRLSRRQKKILTEQYNVLNWNGFKNDAAAFQAGTEVRKALECSVGMALGEFNLLIIDEAHKARGEESGLSRLLNTLFVFAKDARKVGMTATPVELASEDWGDLLSRIGLDDSTDVKATIKAYCDSLHALRERWRSSEQAQTEFKEKAKSFQAALSPYVLRRDKREDPDVRLFIKKNTDAVSYRSIQQIDVTCDSLSLPWKEAVCAAEALSHVTQLCEDSTLKRARLTMGSGHGIASFMDSAWECPDDDGSEADDVQPDRAEKTDDKRLARAHWWKARLVAPCVSKKDVLYAYPTIQKAVEHIESITQSNNKVLVFGRYTKPMKALTALLNAREMLRCLASGEFWPQKVLTDDDKCVVEFVLRQPEYARWKMKVVEDTLAKQYEKRRNAMRTLQRHALAKIDAGLQAWEKTRGSDGTLDLELLKPAYASLKGIIDAERGSDDENALYPLLCRALREILGQSEDWNDMPDIEYARAFSTIIHAATVPDDWDKNGDGKLDAEEAEQDLWPTVHEVLKENYGAPQGGFARFMYGETSHTTRRFLQVAFNRLKSYPKVLVAQSLVGREGLNLHTACRHVFLLHPEWNPGAVEQQVGRVDRVGSLWAQTIQSGNDDSCTINVHGLVFKNTYDEYNWQVLLERWADLRAQLHGEIIPPREITEDDRQRYCNTLTDLAQCAPNFSPPQRTTAQCKKV